jgi:crossover junction endodeoxyribonuclease RuvC
VPRRKAWGADVRILGVDPGLEVTGWAVLDSHGGRVTLVDAGVIITKQVIRTASKATEQVRARCSHIGRELEVVLDSFEPERAAVEAWLPYQGKRCEFDGSVEEWQANRPKKAFLQQSPHTGRVIGVIQEVLRRRGIQMVEYSSQAGKFAVTKNRTASKAQVGQLVARLLGLSRPLSKHVSDACAQALRLLGDWEAQSKQGRSNLDA